jgi:probable rRNA maturation factor
MSHNFTLVNETSAPTPIGAFDAMKQASLGSKYVLNLVITTPAKMKKMNAIYRNKECPTDILSFPLGEREGEIYLCLSEAKKKMKKFERTFENFVAFLFIHGCAHLKGYDHGATMERIEAKIRKQFGI